MVISPWSVSVRILFCVCAFSAEFLIYSCSPVAKACGSDYYHHGQGLDHAPLPCFIIFRFLLCGTNSASQMKDTTLLCSSFLQEKQPRKKSAGLVFAVLKTKPIQALLSCKNFGHNRFRVTPMQCLFQLLPIHACGLDSGDHKPVTKHKMCNGDSGKHVQKQKM